MQVNLLVRLYPRIISRATVKDKSVRGFMKAVVIINNAALTMTKIAAALLPIIPEGISLFLVLGLSASNLLSASLLNPIAALRAKIMHRTISSRSLRLKVYSGSDTASEKPISANGIAKTVWLNFTSEK